MFLMANILYRFGTAGGGGGGGAAAAAAAGAAGDAGGDVESMSLEHLMIGI